MVLYIPFFHTLFDAQSKVMMGVLGVWTPQEDHQLGAWNNLSCPLSFGMHGSSAVDEDKTWQYVVVRKDHMAVQKYQMDYVVADTCMIYGKYVDQDVAHTWKKQSTSNWIKSSSYTKNVFIKALKDEFFVVLFVCRTYKMKKLLYI